MGSIVSHVVPSREKSSHVKHSMWVQLVYNGSMAYESSVCIELSWEV